MLNYKDFMSDFLLESIINESALYYTKDFKDKLYDIRDKSEIAKDLIDIEYTDVEPDMTFISLGDEEGTIKFSQINNILSKIKKRYTEIAEEHPDSRDSLLKTLDVTLDKIKSVKLSQSELNFFYNEESFGIKSSSRNQTSLGRLINKILPGKYSSKEVEDFVNLFKSTYKDVNKFELISGEEIVRWYNHKNYESQMGDLGGSCMRYDRCQKYFDIYTKNPDSCKLLILREGALIKGRALIWKLETNPYSEYFMDRVYAIDDSVKSLFDQWADDNKYLRKYKYGEAYLQDFILRNEDVESKISVKLDEWIFKSYPYMDTFRMLDIEEGTLHNGNDSDKSGYYILESTSGGFIDTSGKWSEYYEEFIPKDKAVFSEYLNDWIWLSKSIEVRYGDNDGYYPDDYDELVKDPYRGWIHKDDAVWSDYYGEYILGDDVVEVVTYFDLNGDYGEDVLSKEDSSIIRAYRMDCYEFLESKGFDWMEFSDDILSFDKETNKYYFYEHEVLVYKTNIGDVSEVDAKVLGVNTKNVKSYKTDSLAYNFKLENKKDLIKRLKEKISQLEYSLSGKQTKIRFSQAQDDQIESSQKSLLSELKERLKELE